MKALCVTAKAPLAAGIHEAVIASLNDYDQTISEIAAELDPQAAASVDNLTTERMAFTEKLAPELIRDFERLGNCVEDVSLWREMASFYLGCAVAWQIRDRVQR
jgi:hypothetical protein